jgi:ribose/xylose/arabinose/galactoside ABC-type transport system permease subunit
MSEPIARWRERFAVSAMPKSWRQLVVDGRSLLPVIRVTFMVGLAVLALTTPGFLSRPSILALLTTVSFIGCVAVGMTLITLSGNIMSFSLGAIVGATAMIFIAAANWGGLAFGFAAALAAGALLNAAQGFVIGWAGANPIVVSIAALSLVYGGVEAISGATIYAHAGLNHGILKGEIAGVPLEFVTFLGVTAIGQLILILTVFGRNLYMVGGSQRAAEAVGVRTWRTISGAYLWAGVFTALAGIMLAIRYDSASMDFGVGYEYEAVAAVLVGGTAVKGGEGSVVRTFAGALIIAIIQVVLLLKGLREEWQYLLAGLIVLAVVVLQTRGAGD